MSKNDSTKKELFIRLRSVLKMVQFIIFFIIQLILLPLTLIGYIFLIIKINTYMKKHRISPSSPNPLTRRWVLHIFGLRKDKDGAKMITSLPFMSETGLWLMMGPTFIANRICGYIPKLARVPEPEKASLMNFVNARTKFFDKLIEENIEYMDQIVFMGAGFDTRAFMYCKGKNIKVFELDKGYMQSCKIETFKKAGVDYKWITFVPIDFNRESWMDKLIDFDFDTSKKTLFIWEGVTPYLKKESVKQTLKAVAKSSGKDSIIIFDYYSKLFVKGEGSILLKLGAKSQKKNKEPWVFFIDTLENPKENVKNLLMDAGLTLEKLSLMGETTENRTPFGGLVKAVKV